MLYMGFWCTFILSLLIFFTYAYFLVLSIATISSVLLGVFLAQQNNQQDTISTFELNDQGQCIFDGNNYYQIQQGSRFSFLGYWLILQPISVINTMFDIESNSSKTLFFIYQDSLNKQDSSRLSNVISQLNH